MYVKLVVLDLSGKFESFYILIEKNLENFHFFLILVFLQKPLHFASDRINWSFIRDVSILGKGRMRAHPATQGLRIQAA